MSKSDWYRNRTWTAKEKEEFFARLGRSRTDYNKAQYVRIQAYTLQAEASPPNYQAALDLLDYMLREIPHSSQIASAYFQRAKCLEALGQVEEALEAFRESIKFGLNKNGIQTTDAPLHFAKFVIKNSLKSLYDEVLGGLKGCEIIGILPNNQYLLCAVMAIIGSETGRAEEARKYILKALEIAENVGVQDSDEFLHKRIAKLAGRPQWLGIFVRRK